MSERAQRDVDIQNRVLLKTLTFQTKTTSKYCSKSSSTGAKLKAERWSAVPHHKVITNGLFTPHTCGTGLPPALAAQGTLPLSRALLPPEAVLCSPSFCAGALMLQAAHQHIPSTAAPFHWWWQGLDIPKCSFLWPPRCWNQFPSYSELLFLMLEVEGFCAAVQGEVTHGNFHRHMSPGPWAPQCLELTQLPPQAFWPSVNSWSGLNIPSESAVQLPALGRDVTGQDEQREGPAL